MSDSDKRDWFSVQMMSVPQHSPWSHYAADLGGGEVGVFPVDVLVLEHSRPPRDDSPICFARIRARTLEVDGSSMDVQGWDAFLAFGSTHAAAKEAGEGVLRSRENRETQP